MLDAAFMMEVLDYIPELETVLAECSRILKSGGSLIFSFGNKASLKSKLRELQGRHYMHSYRNVIQSLDKSGLHVAEKEGFNGCRSTEHPRTHLSHCLRRLKNHLG